MEKRHTDELGFLWKILAVASLVFCLSRVASAQSTPGARFQSHSFQYLSLPLAQATMAQAQTATAWNAELPPKYFSMGVAATTANPFRVDLEGSLDNANWSIISTTNTATGIVSSILPKPMLYFRFNAKTLSSTDTITATAIGTP